MLFQLEDVILVGNDTGGAIAQVAATGSPARLGVLVLTSCDAFEHFPPPILKPFIAAAKFAPTFRAALTPLRTRVGRARAYGALAHATSTTSQPNGSHQPSAMTRSARTYGASPRR
jgi:hypothetical protein